MMGTLRTVYGHAVNKTGSSTKAVTGWGGDLDALSTLYTGHAFSRLRSEETLCAPERHLSRFSNVDFLSPRHA
jgi:hypothetical protein